MATWAERAVLTVSAKSRPACPAALRLREILVLGEGAWAVRAAPRLCCSSVLPLGWAMCATERPIPGKAAVRSTANRADPALPEAGILRRQHFIAPALVVEARKNRLQSRRSVPA